MTENEAIESLRYLKEEMEDDSPDMFVYTTGSIGALEMAIKALEEIQKYRAIGTVEECREAREKQKAKKPMNLEYVREDYSWMGECPCCGAYVSENKKYCLMCGQRLDWSKS